MVTTMEQAFVSAIAAKGTPSIAERDRVALAEGMTCRAVVRSLDTGHRFVGYGLSFVEAMYVAVDSAVDAEGCASYAGGAIALVPAPFLCLMDEARYHDGESSLYDDR